MTSPKPIRFAVVGCGTMGARHAEVIRATEGAELVFLQDHNASSAEKIADGLPVTEDYGDILASPDVDAVALCLPSGLHAEFGIKAAEAGKHIVTEKPIDTRIERAKALVEACNRKRVQCATISQNRFADGATALKAALTAGVLGKIALVEASVKWLRHEPYYKDSDWRGTFAGEGGGAVMNQGIHTVDLLLWLFGTPKVVKGLKKVNRPYMETEDVGVAILEFPGGELATLSVTTSAYPGFPEQISIYGMEASCTLETGKLTNWRQEKETPAPEPPTFEAPSEGLSTKLTLFQRQYRNILAAIRGEEKLLVTAEESVAVLETALAIYE